MVKFMLPFADYTFRPFFLKGDRITRANDKHWTAFEAMNRRTTIDQVRRVVDVEVDIFEPLDYMGGIYSESNKRLYRRQGRTIVSENGKPVENGVPMTLDDIIGDVLRLADDNHNLDWILHTSHPLRAKEKWGRCKNCSGSGEVRMSEDGGYLAACGHCAYGHGEVVERGELRGNGRLRSNVALSFDMATNLVRGDLDKITEQRIASVMACRKLTNMIVLQFDPLTRPFSIKKYCEHSRPFDFVYVDGQQWCSPDKLPSPIHPQWIIDLYKESQSRDVGFYFGGWGDWLPISRATDHAQTPDRHNERWLTLDGSKNHTESTWRIRKVGAKSSGCRLEGLEFKDKFVVNCSHATPSTK